jgi:hypothetical protein
MLLGASSPEGSDTYHDENGETRNGHTEVDHELCGK